MLLAIVTSSSKLLTPLTPGEISIDGILLGSRADKVLQKLGAPAETQKLELTTQLCWRSGISLEISNASRLVSRITGTTLMVRRNVAIRKGDRKSEVRAHLYLIVPEYRELGSSCWPTFKESDDSYAIGGYWDSSGHDCSLKILLNCGRVDKILLAEQSL